VRGIIGIDCDGNDDGGAELGAPATAVVAADTAAPSLSMRARLAGGGVEGDDIDGAAAALGEVAAAAKGAAAFAWLSPEEQKLMDPTPQEQVRVTSIRLKEKHSSHPRPSMSETRQRSSDRCIDDVGARVIGSKAVLFQ
jgi:hypothetical protein